MDFSTKEMFKKRHFQPKNFFCISHANLHPSTSYSAVVSMWSIVFFPILPVLFQFAVIDFAILVAYCLQALKGQNYSSGLLSFLQVCTVIQFPRAKEQISENFHLTTHFSSPDLQHNCLHLGHTIHRCIE